MKKLHNPAEPYPNKITRIKFDFKSGAESGFVLIATISVMALVIMIAMAMVGLSTSVVRTSRHGKPMEEAQANARMALVMAISKLQNYSGLDTRITAPANLLVAGAPPLTGVWKSWEGMNHDTDGRPIKPNYEVKNLDSTNSDSRFLGFLVSGANDVTDPTATNLSDLISNSEINGITIPLLSTGSLGTNPGQVHVRPRIIDNNSGAYAWWVSPENQKARLMQPYSPETDDVAGWARIAQSHAIPDTGLLGLNGLNSDLEAYVPDPSDPKPVAKMVSRKTMELLGSTNATSPHLDFHDYSPNAVGLLTNVATGGWKKDLSILSERWNHIYKVTQYTNGKPRTVSERLTLPLFRFRPGSGATSAVRIPLIGASSNPNPLDFAPDQSSLFPWSNYTQLGGKRNPMNYVTASASWQNLISHVVSYKDMSTNGSGIPSKEVDWRRKISESSNNTSATVRKGENFYDSFHISEVQLIVARMQFIVQANAIPDPRMKTDHPDPRMQTPENYHRINLRVVPVVTLWNPYNFEVTKPKFRNNKVFDIGISTMRSLPGVLSIQNTTAPRPHYYKMLNGGNSIGVDGLLENVTTGGNHWYDYQIPANISKGLGGANNSFWGGGTRSFSSFLPLDFKMAPGEVRVLTPFAGTTQQMHTMGIRLKTGYTVGDDAGMMLDPNAMQTPPLAGGRIYKVPTSRPNNGSAQSPLYATDRLEFRVKTDKHTKILTNHFTEKSGIGSYFSVGTSWWPISDEARLATGEVPKGVQDLNADMALTVDEDWGQAYWPSNNLAPAGFSVSELIPGGGNPDWTNVFSITFGPRFTAGAGWGNSQNRPTKGLLQSNPFALNTLSIPEQQASFHPANGQYDFFYHSMTFNSDLSPEVGDKGYIISGFQSGDGLSQFMLSEKPIQPLASLGELQNWGARGPNPLPPHQHFIVGNSDANPMLPQEDVVIANPAFLPVTSKSPTATSHDRQHILQHDDPYCANHVLFDDWFFSSIAPRPVDFGENIAKNIETVYQDLIAGTDLLTNRSYRPIVEDLTLNSTQRNALVNEVINGNSRDGWQKVASRLEVNGMFNVNSTSVKAWRALLGHAKNKGVPYYDNGEVKLDADRYDNVVTRSSVAGDVKASADSGNGALFPNGSQYAGFKVLTEGQLDELAEKIVMQVRARGPFLSLSEFINRQLSYDKDLAIAGALQVALNSLTDDPNIALKNQANQLSEKAMDPASAYLSGVGYDFVEAAEGYSTHGFPGWIRQADILRPLAPILSARDDTFTIRTYGDSRDSEGNILATAWCEATVKRTRHFVDGTDDADSTEPPTNTINMQLGRKYKIMSFRWLSYREV